MVSSSCSTVVRPTHYSGGRCTTTADATLQQKAPYSPSPPPRPWAWGAVEGWAHPTRWGSPLIFCQIFILIHYTMNCYELLLLLLYDALLWAAPAAAIWWIAMSCSCCWYMMNCYEMLLPLLYDELLWAAASIWWIADCCCCMMSCYELLLLLYDAFRWCCYTIITSHLDHRISINNCSSFGSCVLRLN